MKTSPTTTAPTAEQLLDAAASAHRAVSAEPTRALTSALDAGDALTAAKRQVPRGQWAPALAARGVPASTARLYMQLAAHRTLIETAGCTSIREARRLVASHRAGARAGEHDADAADAPPRARPGRRPSYEQGYRDGYAKGKRDGYAAAAADQRPDPQRADVAPPSKRDIHWLQLRSHPDVVDKDTKTQERATRLNQWLNAVNAAR